jgi:hypothetical protein
MTLEADESNSLVDPTEETGQHLVVLLERLNNGRERSLRPGMLATWKPGLKNRRYPRYGEPVVVVALLDTPVNDPKYESGTPYFQEPLDLLLGIMRGEDHEFLVYHVDRRRFQPHDMGES